MLWSPEVGGFHGCDGKNVRGWLVWFVTKSTEAPFPFSLLMIDTVWWSTIAGIWRTFCLLFVAIFQFLRWKDSR